MKLYYSPGACSLADHIAMHEAKLNFEHVKVDLRAKKTETGEEFTAINPKGYVPAVVMDDGSLLTENIAILSWVASQNSALGGGSGPLGQIRLTEALAFISTEVHKSFKPLFAGGSDQDKEKAKETIEKRLNYLADTKKGDFLLGSDLSVADCYLFVMMMWCQKFGITVPQSLTDLGDRMKQRPGVQAALQHEGLA